jgi:molybdenum cofactor biosynthesis enzyme MoaA
MEIHGVEIPLKKYSCSMNGCPSVEQEPYVNLYIKITDACQASCRFCEFRNKEENSFNFNKLKETIKFLKRKLVINKVSFTGGEPLLCPDYLTKAIKWIKDFLPKVEIVVNTNGINMNYLVPILNKINSISLSRHHYVDEENYSVFRSKKIPSFRDIRDFPEKNKLHLRCNLIRGLMDNHKSIITYMDCFSKTGIIDFGFVSLMPLNDYCRNRFVSYEDTGIDSIPNSRIVRRWTYEGCHCKNYIAHTKDGNLIRYYARVNGRPGQCESIATYDKDRLRVGFDGETINI